MRTTLDIEDDVLQAAKELARRDGSTAGRVLSELARRGLAGAARGTRGRPRLRTGVPVLPSRGGLMTMEQVQQLRDEEGV